MSNHAGSYLLNDVLRLEERFRLGQCREQLTELAADPEESVVKVNRGLRVLGKFLGDIQRLLGLLLHLSPFPSIAFS